MIAARIQQVQDPVIPIVARWTSENPGTISLGQGVVHYAPPPEVLNAVAEATGRGMGLHRYGPVAGGDELLELLTEKISRENGIVAKDSGVEIVCSAGANMAFLNAVLAIADVGDEIILLGPYYFNHHMAIEIAGCRVVVVETDSSYQPDVDRIRKAITPKTRAVVTVSPNNPTGAVIAGDLLFAINEMCAESGIYHISDEAYEYFLYGDASHVSPGSFDGAAAHTISLFSLSKAYGLAGWRVGYSVVPKHLLIAIKKIQDTNLICPPTICQVAAEAALRVGSDWCRRQIGGLGEVRDSALQVLAELGDRCCIAVPGGAFYLFLTLQSSQDDMVLVKRLIEENSVAVLPGSAFGVTKGCSLRISYGALDAESVIEGVGRLRDGLDRLL